MADKFDSYREDLESPANNAAAITPHDSNELANYSRAIYVGGTGNIVVILQDDTAAVTFTSVPVGTVLPIRAKIVKSTGTTATNLVAIY